MYYFINRTLAIASIVFSLSSSSFSQEFSVNASNLKIQYVKVDPPQLQSAVVNLDILSKLAAFHTELLQLQKNKKSITIKSFDKVKPEDLRTKEISMELAADKLTDIFIENNRNLNIKVWDQPKVKISTTVKYEEATNNFTDAEWFEKLNLIFRSTNNSIKIKVGADFDLANVIVARQIDGKKNVTIYIPKDNNLNIDSRYAEITIDGNLNKLNVDISNGSLDADDVNKFLLRSKYSKVNMGNLKSAEVDLFNGRFIVKDADDLDLDTKYATVEAGAVKKLIIRSTNDEYEIEEVGSIVCQKNYGNLRISKLYKFMDLDGANADIKIRNIGEGLESIKINNKYADIRLPMSNVKNYTVSYQGPYSTIYANFEKKLFIERQDIKRTEKNSTVKIRGTFNVDSIDYAKLNRFDNNSETHFTATVGDGQGAKLNLKCQSCIVDFK